MKRVNDRQNDEIAVLALNPSREETPRRLRRPLAAVTLALYLWGMLPGFARAEDPEDELGDWSTYI